MNTLSIISTIIGWCYFAAWSISFWPQAILNYQRKSVSGLSFEFLTYNITGFVFYSIYSTVKYITEVNADVDTDDRDVTPPDLAFGYHAILLTIITIGQCFYYGMKTVKVHAIHGYILALLWGISIYTLILAACGYLKFYPLQDATFQNPNAFTLCDLLGYNKVAISFIKYLPQLYLNYKRKCTVGWSIVNILLDFTGGTLSFLQQTLDSINTGSTNPLFGNIPKFLLAAISIVFDIMFMIQHYVLYRGNKPPEGEDEEEFHANDGHYMKDDDGYRGLLSNYGSGDEGRHYRASDSSDMIVNLK
jgi:cystinosin